MCVGKSLVISRNDLPMVKAKTMVSSRYKLSKKPLGFNPVSVEMPSQVESEVPTQNTTDHDYEP